MNNNTPFNNIHRIKNKTIKTHETEDKKVEVVENQTIEITGELPILFKLGLKALIKAKSDALILLRELELDLLNAKHDLAKKERLKFIVAQFSNKLFHISRKISIKTHFFFRNRVNKAKGTSV